MDLLTCLEDLRELLGHRPTGLFVDIDGTLAPIASTPGEASVSPEARGALEALADRMTVVALTGRSVTDARRIIGLDSITYAGNHGLEWWWRGEASVVPEAVPYGWRLRSLIQDATRRLKDISGLLVEDKGVTLALHYRLAKDPDAAQDSILAFLRDTPSARGFVHRVGKMLVEVNPPVQANKGTALQRVVREDGLRSALALGDDRTDLDAFRAVRTLRRDAGFRGLTVAVQGPGAPEELLSEADYTLPDTHAVERLLGWLVEASRATEGPSG